MKPLVWTSTDALLALRMGWFLFRRFGGVVQVFSTGLVSSPFKSDAEAQDFVLEQTLMGHSFQDNRNRRCCRKALRICSGR